MADTDAETNVVEKDGNHNSIRLGEVWNRINSLCLKLWQEDRVAAVGLQALIEEFRGEIARAEQLLEGLQRAMGEQRRTLETTMETRHAQEKTKWQDQANALQQRISFLEDTLKSEKSRGEELIKQVERAERALDDYKEQTLKKEADLDSKHAEKMRELYEELQKKEATEESFWIKQRHEWEEERSKQIRDMEAKNAALEERAKQLEVNYQQKIEEMQKRYEAMLATIKNRTSSLEHEYNKKGDELMATYNQLKNDLEARETKSTEWENALRQREGSIEERARELENGYQKKNQDLEKVKEELKMEVSRIVREYRARQSQVTT